MRAVERGFTLIELLVVVAVIAVLMGILLPVVSQVKEQARSIACAGNLHQYALAGRVYIDDNKGKFPSPHRLIHADYNSAAKAPEYCQWHNAALEFNGLLFEYMETKGVHLCPTFKMVSRSYGAGHFMHDPSIPIEPQYSYSQNGYLGDGPYGVALKEGQVKRPQGVFLFSEENMWPISGLSTAELNNTHLLVRYPPYRPKDYSDCIGTFHNVVGGKSASGTGNAGFVDGHVGKVKAKEQTEDNGLIRIAWPFAVTTDMCG